MFYLYFFVKNVKHILRLIFFLFIITIVLTYNNDLYAVNSIQKRVEQICKADEPEVINLFDKKLFSSAIINNVMQLLNGYKQKYGNCKSANHIKNNKVEYTFNKAKIGGKLILNKDNKIIGIWFDQPKLNNDNINLVLNDFKQLSGLSAFSVKRSNNTNLFSYNSEKALAVGSAFKLFVLKTLLKKIQYGKMKWDDVIYLSKQNYSMPTGILQSWPENSPLTLYSLAVLMISKSDNTATDTLISHLGKVDIENIAGFRNRPFLSTLDMFKLKSKGFEKHAKKYVNSNLKQKRKILINLSKLDKDKVKFYHTPYLINEIEWFFSTDELCSIMLSLKDLKILSVNPGSANKNDWKQIAYKGGSEPGVINMTYALQHPKTSKWYCVSSSWNDPDNQINQNNFSELVGRILHLLLEKQDLVKQTKL